MLDWDRSASEVLKDLNSPDPESEDECEIEENEQTSPVTVSEIVGVIEKMRHYTV